MSIHEQFKAMLSDPASLEHLYRQDPQGFKAVFDEMRREHPDSELLAAWQARLNYRLPQTVPPADSERAPAGMHPVFLIIVLGLLAALFPNIPYLLGWDYELRGEYFARYSGFFYLAPVAVYFLVRRTHTLRTRWSVLGGFALTLLYMAWIPMPEGPNTSADLAAMHVHLVLWGLTGLAFVGDHWQETARRMAFLKLNGEALVYTGVLYLGGIVLVILIGTLFGALGSGTRWIEWVVLGGIFSAPAVAAHLVFHRYFSQTIAPVMAKIFSPLVLLVLGGFIAASFFSERNPYTDRNSLMIFNFVLLVVLALITFAISDRQEDGGPVSFLDWVTPLLIMMALGMDVMALAAILERLGEYGVSPNRMAVLGANVLVFVNLAMVLYRYVRFMAGKISFANVQRCIVKYLPVYVAWVCMVTFLFPVLFQFR